MLRVRLQPGPSRKADQGGYCDEDEAPLGVKSPDPAGDVPLSAPLRHDQ
jgi:hypothetical protein